MSPDSPIFRWLNDSWDHPPPERVVTDKLRGRYAHVLGCTAAGLCGGLLMALLQAGMAVSNGHDARTPFYLIDHLFRGFFSLTLGTASAFGLGVAVHFALSALFGAFFAVLLRTYADETSKLDALFGGLAYGVLIWAFTNYGFILRWSDSSLSQQLDTPPSAWFFAHLLFGATLVLSPTLTAAIRRRSKRGRDGDVAYPPRTRAA